MLISQKIKQKVTLITVSLVPLMEIMGEKNPGEYEESDTYISVKGNLKKHLSFWEKTISGNQTVCDILKSGYILPFLYTPSNVELENNSLALKNSEFVEESIRNAYQNQKF